MEIIVTILIYIGALMGGHDNGNQKGHQGNHKGIHKKLIKDNPGIVDFIDGCNYGTIDIKVKKTVCTFTHSHNSTNECHIHVINKKNGKTFEKTLGNGCILKLIAIDDLAD